MGCGVSKPLVLENEGPQSTGHESRPSQSKSVTPVHSAPQNPEPSGTLSTPNPNGGSSIPPTNHSGSVNPFPAYPRHLAPTSPSGRQLAREFSFAELEEATDFFNEELVLGEGGFGKVYQGWIEEGGGSPGQQMKRRQVAVKKLNPEGLQGINEWLTEVLFLRKLHHPHLVHLVGYCTEGDKILLVYEYMPKGSLDVHLFSGSESNGRTLTWQERVKIALGAAKGLAYLHEGTDRQVIFRDFKASNILLDHDFTSKLSDFGLAKDGPAGDKTHVSTKVVGTYGYTAPEYMQTGHLTVKSDVYAFGVVLLELLSGRRAVDMSLPWEERSLVFWAKPFLADRRKLGKLVDPKLEGRYPVKGAQKLAVSAHCCLLEAKSRPTMTDMVQTLQALQEKSDLGLDGEGRGHYRTQSASPVGPVGETV